MPRVSQEAGDGAAGLLAAKRVSRACDLCSDLRLRVRENARDDEHPLSGPGVQGRGVDVLTLNTLRTLTYAVLKFTQRHDRYGKMGKSEEQPKPATCPQMPSGVGPLRGRSLSCHQLYRKSVFPLFWAWGQTASPRSLPVGNTFRDPPRAPGTAGSSKPYRYRAFSYKYTQTMELK